MYAQHRRTVRFAAMATLLFVAEALWIVTRLAENPAARTANNVLSLTSATVGGLACLWAAKNDAKPRRAWNLLGCAGLAWAAGQLVWTVYEEILGQEVPFPSLADVGYLLLIPLAAAGLYQFLSPMADRASRWRLGMDGVFIASSLLFVSWVTVLGPLFAMSNPAETFANIISLAYPLSDVILATFIFLVASRTVRFTRMPMVIVGIGLLAFLTADSGFAILVALDLYGTGNPIDLGWSMGLLLVGVAAVLATEHPTPREENDRLSNTLALAAANAPAVVAVGVATVLVLRDGEIGAVPFSMLLVTGLVLLTRQLLTQLHDLRLAKRTEAAYARLKELEEERENLLRIVAHDLSGPLAPIAMQIHLLKNNPEKSVTNPKTFEILENNINHLRVLVGDLRDMMKIGNGQLRVEAKVSDLRDILATAVQSQSEVAKTAGVAVFLHSETSLPVRADPQRITQVVYNLVSNAIKFTPAGGTIHVVAGPIEGQARVSVQDAGRGMNEDEIGKLFRPFSQVHKPGEAREQGSGLGLYICKGLLDAHGGRIWAESKGHGFGSSFTFELPLDSRPFDIRNAVAPPSGAPTPPPAIERREREPDLWSLTTGGVSKRH